jgi:hypothetical protein
VWRCMTKTTLREGRGYWKPGQGGLGAYRPIWEGTSFSPQYSFSSLIYGPEWTDPVRRFLHSLIYYDLLVVRRHLTIPSQRYNRVRHILPNARPARRQRAECVNARVSGLGKGEQCDGAERDFAGGPRSCIRSTNANISILLSLVNPRNHRRTFDDGVRRISLCCMGRTKVDRMTVCARACFFMRNARGKPVLFTPFISCLRFAAVCGSRKDVAFFVQSTLLP